MKPRLVVAIVPRYEMPSSSWHSEGISENMGQLVRVGFWNDVGTRVRIKTMRMNNFMGNAIEWFAEIGNGVKSLMIISASGANLIKGY